MKAIAALAACLAALTAAAQDYSKVEVKSEKLAEGLYMLTGAGGNMGLSVGADTTFLVDDQFAPLSAKITAAIGALSPKPVKFLVNTHWHGDHAGGNENFGKAGALILAHDNVRKRMSTEQFIAFMNMKTKPEPKDALPVVTFSTDSTFYLNGEEIYVRHLPRAHTDGDVVVTFRKADVVHMGDIFFNGMYPFIDMGSGGSPEGVVAAADQVLAATGEKTRFIPGHGPMGTRADLKAYRDMVASVATRVRAQVKAGKKLEEIVATKPTAEFDEQWGKGFLKPDKFVEMLVAGMQSGS